MESLENLSQEIIRTLTVRRETVSTAESCTGGLLAKALTDVAGSSSVFYGSFVTYTNDVKIRVLGVPAAVIDRDTEVSFACAEEMARRVREKIGTTYGISTTGYAGPAGGTDRDPVGTVYIAVSTPTHTISERFSAPPTATRQEIRTAAATRALEMLREER